VLAPHVGYPGMGRLVKADVGYTWVPLHFKPMP